MSPVMRVLIHEGGGKQKVPPKRNRKANTMAKELSATELVAALIAAGFTPPEDLQAKADASLSDEAFHHLSDKVIVKLSDEDDNAKNRKARNEKVTAWQERAFILAADMVNDFVSDTKNVGRGQQIERFASLKTPNGTLVMRLRDDVPTEETESDK